MVVGETKWKGTKHDRRQKDEEEEKEEEEDKKEEESANPLGRQATKVLITLICNQYRFIVLRLTSNPINIVVSS